MSRHPDPQQTPFGPTPGPGEEELFVSRALDHLVVPEPSAALMGRILQAMPQPRIGWREFFGFAPASAFLAAITLGLWLGAGVMPANAFPEETDWLATAFGDDIVTIGEVGP